MFATNPFAALSASSPPAVIQGYVIVMVVLVAAGTLFDIVHKGSAKYFFDSWRRSKAKGLQQVPGGELLSIEAVTVSVVVLSVSANVPLCVAIARLPARSVTMYS